ncbi:alpha/beta fold hydrolase [Streptomyces sp. NPDC005708]|uniref:alpha/beta fold hydrolase n=1 Tax=Streptomyces sp. NPDC005708 TaxID=3154564 RepID=UPI0033C1AC21
MTVHGRQIFYREAGPADAPVLVLLHGFPTSSYMYRNLIPALADRYRLIAPDYLGYGWSDAPTPDQFTYTFESMTTLITDFIATLGLRRYSLYLQDFGAPIGFRIAARHPQQVSAIISQNGNAYVEGITPPILAGLNAPPDPKVLRYQVSLEFTKSQYLTGVPDPSLVDPDSWMHDQELLDRPGNDLIQFAMLEDYKNNLAAYAEFQTYFRTSQVPLLAVWGANDPIFIPAGARAFKKDLPHAEVHLLNTGHFALETHTPEIAAYIRDFLPRAHTYPHNA